MPQLINKILKIKEKYNLLSIDPSYLLEKIEIFSQKLWNKKTKEVFEKVIENGTIKKIGRTLLDKQ